MNEIKLDSKALEAALDATGVEPDCGMEAPVEAAIRAYLSALTGQVVAPVSVKPLEWELFEHRHSIARTPFGAYEVQELRDGRVRMRFGSSSFEPFRGTPEAAKAAAQADYEARIRSALAAVHTPPIEGLEE